MARIIENSEIELDNIPQTKIPITLVILYAITLFLFFDKIDKHILPPSIGYTGKRLNIKV